MPVAAQREVNTLRHAFEQQGATLANAARQHGVIMPELTMGDVCDAAA